MFGNYPKEMQRKADYNYTIDIHSVTEIKEAAHNFSLINIFFPLHNKEGNCKFVISQVPKFPRKVVFPQLPTPARVKRQHVAPCASRDLVPSLLK